MSPSSCAGWRGSKARGSASTCRGGATYRVTAWTEWNRGAQLSRVGSGKGITFWRSTESMCTKRNMHRWPAPPHYSSVDFSQLSQTFLCLVLLSEGSDNSDNTDSNWSCNCKLVFISSKPFSNGSNIDTIDQTKAWQSISFLKREHIFIHY